MPMMNANSSLSNGLADWRCRICGSSDVRYEDERGGVECAGCFTLSAREIPDDAVLLTYYRKYNSRYSGGGRSGGRNQLIYAQQYLKKVKAIMSEGLLLDIGCANNPFPNMAASAGFAVTAMDYSPPDNLFKNVTFRTGHLNSSSLLAVAERYDTVTAWAVIEHVANPNLEFKILATLTKNGGRIHLTTPEYGTYLTKLSARRTRWFYPPEHLHLISPSAVQLLADANGLRLIKWSRFEISPIRWFVRYAVGIAEALEGLGYRQFNHPLWLSRACKAKAKFIGIAYYELLKP